MSPLPETIGPKMAATGQRDRYTYKLYYIASGGHQ